MILQLPLRTDTCPPSQDGDTSAVLGLAAAAGYGPQTAEPGSSFQRATEAGKGRSFPAKRREEKAVLFIYDFKDYHGISGACQRGAAMPRRVPGGRAGQGRLSALTGESPTGNARLPSPPPPYLTAPFQNEASNPR